VKPEYDLKDLPEVPGARPDRVVLDAFKLGAAKLVAEAWEMDVAKVFASVDISKSGIALMRCTLIARQKGRRPVCCYPKVLQEGPG
jgi:arginyl-tRNA synthetase